MQLAAAACRAKLEEAKRTFRERAALDRELETWKASKRLRTFCEGIVEDDPEFANALFASMIPSTRKGKKDFDSWTDKEKIKLINEWKGHWDDHLKKSLSSGVHGEATVEWTEQEREAWAPLLEQVPPKRKLLNDLLDLNLPPVLPRAEWTQRKHVDRCDEAKARRRFQSRTMMDRLGARRRPPASDFFRRKKWIGTRPALRFANRKGAPVYEFYTKEFVRALARYVVRRLAPTLRSRGTATLLEIGSGDGRLCLHLRHALPPQIVVLASDAVAHPEPAFPVTLAVHSDVLDAVERPDLVLICWHAPNQDFTAVVRDKESVQEYLLLGPPDSSDVGHDAATWGGPDEPRLPPRGWHRKAIPSVSRFMVSRADLTG